MTGRMTAGDRALALITSVAVAAALIIAFAPASAEAHARSEVGGRRVL
jgi:hypothetical protein